MTKSRNPQSFYKDQLMKPDDFFLWDTLTKLTNFFLRLINDFLLQVIDKTSDFYQWPIAEIRSLFFKTNWWNYIFFSEIHWRNFRFFFSAVDRRILQFFFSTDEQNFQWWIFFRHWLTKSMIFSREQLMKFVSFFHIRLLKFLNTSHNRLTNIWIFPTTDWRNLQVWIMLIFEKHKNSFKSIFWVVIFFFFNLHTYSILNTHFLESANNKWLVKFGKIWKRYLWNPTNSQKNHITDWGTLWLMRKLKSKFDSLFL